VKGSTTTQADVTAAAPAEASIEWIRDFEQRFQHAWNSHQADRVLVLMTEDIEYRDALGRRRCAVTRTSASSSTGSGRRFPT
jgi:ketosteroid isomerase-like protein